MIDAYSNVGKCWSEFEEKLLLDELNENIDIDTIAQLHKRKIGGINSRRKEIAYKMFLKNIEMDKIIQETKLDKNTIHEFILLKQNKHNIPPNKKSISTNDSMNNNNELFYIRNDLIGLKNDLFEIKNNLIEIKKYNKKFIKLLKNIYEFEQ